MEKKPCYHKRKEIIDSLYDKEKNTNIMNNDKNVVIDITPPLQLPVLPTLPTLPTLPVLSQNDKLTSGQTITSSLVSENKKEDILIDFMKKTSISKSENLEHTTSQNMLETKIPEYKNNAITSLMINQTRDLFVNITIEEIHLNFKTLGRIKEYDKMYLRDGKFLEVDDSYMQSVSRTLKNTIWNGYNREDVIDFLIHLTEQTLKTCDALAHSLKMTMENDGVKNSLTNLLIDMEQALMGLQKMKITYYNDNAILTRMDMVIDKFDKKIRETKDYLLKN
jgi:hypothetical protein